MLSALLPSSDLIPDLSKAAAWLQEADAVLICAGAGMSGNAGEMVYTNPSDFARYYPWLLQYGYLSCYECMGMFGDPNVPEAIKRTYMVAHAWNQRYKFAPNPSYEALLAPLQAMGKDYFVFTSNVDGCFERAGFDAQRIYTPQGDWSFMQCERACTRNSYWKATAQLEELAPLAPHIPESSLPKCPKCGRGALGSVRGGSWFTHAPYDEAQDRFLEWMQTQQEKAVSSSSGRSRRFKLAILEVGAGFNTPIVTRLPMEQICRETAEAVLVRINPKNSEVPEDLEGRGKALGLPCGWSPELARSLFEPAVRDLAPPPVAAAPAAAKGSRRAARGQQVDWKAVLRSLREQG